MIFNSLPTSSTTCSFADPNDVLFVTLDSCRFDTFSRAHSLGLTPNLSSVAPFYKAIAPSYYTYGSHSSFWMGFTPGIGSVNKPFFNPKFAKLFKMQFSGFAGSDSDCFQLVGRNIIEGFANLGYVTIGTGAVSWFDTSTSTGLVLTESFDHFFYSGNTWSLRKQLLWIDRTLSSIPGSSQRVNRFVFLNIGETHVPYWHEEASWSRAPSPCIPFGGETCDAHESARRQQACLAWVDTQLRSLLNYFKYSTIFICSDHGDCWGEDGLWEHGISHPMTLEVPLLIRFRGVPLEMGT